MRIIFIKYKTVILYKIYIHKNEVKNKYNLN